MKAYFQQPLDEQFNDSYLTKGLQPSVGSVSPVMNVRVINKYGSGATKTGVAVARKATGTTMQATGTALRVGGKGLEAGGTAAQRAGAAVSTTGVGAVVGAPLAVAGTGMRVAGKVSEAAGKVMGTGGRRVAAVSGASVLDRMEVSRKNFFIIGWGLMIWRSAQLPFAILTVILLAIVQFIADLILMIKPQEGEKGVWSWVYDAATSFTGTFAEVLIKAIKYFTGIDLTIFDPAGMAMLAYMMTFAIGIVTLMLVGLVYLLAGYNSLSGKGAAFKIGAFLLAIVGYSVPILSMFPWFILWTMAVWFYPK